MNTENTIPTGYLQNAQGHLVPEDKIRPLDRLRNDLVQEIIHKSVVMQDAMRDFKTEILSDVHCFIDLAAEEYDTKMGGKKGNISLVSFNGDYKVMLTVADTLAFDERLQVAKVLIDKCIHDWTKDSNTNIKALIEHAFQADKQGNINTSRVLGLLKLEIDDASWKDAMRALKDSISIISSKSYIRLYQRKNADEKFEQISLDMAAL